MSIIDQGIAREESDAQLLLLITSIFHRHRRRYGSRRIVGWSFRDDMIEALVLGTLKKSIKAIQPSGKLIHHTDRGGQYAGKAYR